MYRTINVLKAEFINGEAQAIDAIEVLQDQFNYQPKDAEELVGCWQEGKDNE